jgi:hypothetical protein
MIHTHKCVECQVPMTCCCEDRRDVNRLTGKRRPLRCATCEPSSVDVHYPNPFDEIKTVSREAVAPVPAENAAETGAGQSKETKQTPAPAAPGSDSLLVITTKNGWRFQLRNDGYRVYAKKLSTNPINIDTEEDCVFEYKHSSYECADEIMDRLWDMLREATVPA